VTENKTRQIDNKRGNPISEIKDIRTQQANSHNLTTVMTTTDMSMLEEYENNELRILRDADLSELYPLTGDREDIFNCSDSDMHDTSLDDIHIDSDFSLFDSFCDMNNILKMDTTIPYELQDSKRVEPLPGSSPFDTNNFPTSVDDISLFLDSDHLHFTTKTQDKHNDMEIENKSNSLTVPVIKVERNYHSDSGYNDNSEESEEEEAMNETEYLQPPKKIQRLQTRKYSSTDEDSDEDWCPESFTINDCKEKTQMSKKKPQGISAIRKPNPIPQRRAPGTKQKITRWIVGLLRDPKCNPKVITWVDEKAGVFQVTDTNAYAKLWGKVKGNPGMTYEKLSRAMRYSYRNQELHAVVEKRLTYKFGKNMVDFRATNSDDPNFEKFHAKRS